MLVCSTCPEPTPITKASRKHETHYMADTKVHRLRFTVCSMCDSLMRLNRWERVDREFAVVRKHLERKALEGN